MSARYELYCQDCLEVMRGMADKSVDVVITDPPYGVGRDKGFYGAGGFNGVGKPIPRRCYDDDWDQSRPGKEYFDEILRVGKTVIIFGGNYFADVLPVGTHWIVWDKVQTMPTFGDCELIWTNVNKKSVKLLRREYNGVLGREGVRYHPTQKSLKVLGWLVEHYSEPGMVIFDPFMGVGSTGVAAVRAGRNFIGVEIQSKYFDIAQARINEAVMQIPLFFSGTCGYKVTYGAKE